MFEDMETVNKLEQFRAQSDSMDDFLKKILHSELSITTVEHSLEVLGYHTLENFYNLKEA